MRNLTDWRAKNIEKQLQASRPSSAFTIQHAAHCE